MTKEHIVVIGAGIAGLHLAIQILTHAADLYAVSVYEKSGRPSDSTPNGFAIILSPNATRILSDLDLEFVACGTPLTSTTFRSTATPDVPLHTARGLVADEETLLTVERGALVRLLLERVEVLGGRVFFGWKLRGFRVGDDGGRGAVAAVFAGGEEVEAALLVGADGVHSVVRRGLYAGVPRSWSGRLARWWRGEEGSGTARETGWEAVYGIARLPFEGGGVGEGDEGDEGGMQLYVDPYRPGAYATYGLRGGRVFWVVYRSSSHAKGAGAGAEGGVDEEAPYVFPGGRRGNFGEVMRGSEEERGGYRAKLFHGVFGRGCNEPGNVVVIGDAAHPQTTFLGQGAGRGLEEGVELVSELLRDWEAAEKAADRGEAVRRFVEAGKKRSWWVAVVGWWMGCAVMGDWWVGRKARDWAFRWLGRRERKGGGKVGEERVRKSDKAENVEDEGGGHWLFDYSPRVQRWDNDPGTLRLGRQRAKR